VNKYLYKDLKDGNFLLKTISQHFVPSNTMELGGGELGYAGKE